MKCRLLFDCGCRVDESHPDGIRRAGEIIEHPDAYKLVRRGAAESADEECEQAADMTPDQLEFAQKRYPMIAAGIHPEDYGAWERGEMRGYYPDGSHIPGPNAPDEEEEEYEFADEDYDGDEW